MTSLGRTVFLTLATIVTAGTLFWLWDDSLYALQVFGSPRELGLAARVDYRALDNNAYVKIEGVPRFSKAIAFSVGLRLRESSAKDMTLFPLAGQPGIFVQWKDPKKARAIGGAPRLPSEFKGRLLNRSSLGHEYSRLWEYLEKEMGIVAPADAMVIIAGETPLRRSWIFAVWGGLVVLIVLNVLGIRRRRSARLSSKTDGDDTSVDV